MFGWDDAEQAHQQVYQQGGGYDNPDPDNKGKFSHELIAGGAAFEGFKLYEDHQRKEGKTVNHQFAKEVLAGFVGGEVDKLAETHGMNEYDRYEARKHATESAGNMYDQHYVQNEGANQYNPNEYGPPPQINNYYNNYNN
ncbi:hypothetical protein MMC17_008553 [Xylographa soralifera]|nr:hypothetical protein [Xylographa vitiligo]MCJ1385430.1 hypothetical protein [Xylographa soralifera]